MLMSTGLLFVTSTLTRAKAAPMSGGRFASERSSGYLIITGGSGVPKVITYMVVGLVM
jgi:hypothetical protein